MRRFLAPLITVALLGLLLPTVALAAPAEKTVVCHLTENGSYRTIEVANPSLPDHLGHGDSIGAAAVPDAGYGPCEDSDGDGILDVDEADICVEIDGVRIISHGLAECITTPTIGVTPNVAIAHDGSTARAQSGNGLTAIANGSNTTARAIGGDTATALANGNNTFAEAGGGANNLAIANGPGGVSSPTRAVAIGGNDNTATATGEGTRANAGAGDNNTATATGDFAWADASRGDNNTATATGYFALAFAGPGNNNTATAIGNPALAVARAPDGCVAEAIGDLVFDFCP